MPNRYTDWNLFNQISQTSGYQEKSAMKQRELGYVSELEARAKKREEEQMIYSDAMSGYLEKIDESMGSLLPEDTERIQALEKELKQGVFNKIKQAGGDMKRFYLTGGSSALRDYKAQLMNSKEVKRAMNNRGIYDQIIKDQSEQKMLLDVNLEVSKGGKKTVERFSAEEMLRLFSEGKIDSLSYNGSQKPIKVDPKMFLNQGNPRDRYNPGKVSVEDFYNASIAVGNRPEIAAKMAKAADKGDGNTGLWWGVDDMDYNGLSKYYGFGKGGSKGRYGKVAAKFAPIMQYLTTGKGLQLRDIDHVTWTPKEGEPQQMMIGKQVVDQGVMSSIGWAFGLKENLSSADKPWSGSFINPFFINMNSGLGVNLNANEYNLEKLHSGIQIVRSRDGKTTQAYVLADVRISEDKAEDLDIERSMAGLWDYRDAEWKKKDAAVYRDEEGMDDSYKITVGVRIPTNPLFTERLNAKIGYKAGQTMGGVDFEDYSSQTVTAPEGAPLPNEYKIQQSNYFSPYGVNRTQSSSEVARIINEIAQKENVSPEQVLQVMKERYGNR